MLKSIMPSFSHNHTPLSNTNLSFSAERIPENVGTQTHQRQRNHIATADIPQVIPHPRRPKPCAVSHRCKRRQGSGHQHHTQHPRRQQAPYRNSCFFLHFLKSYQSGVRPEMTWQRYIPVSAVSQSFRKKRNAMTVTAILYFSSSDTCFGGSDKNFPMLFVSTPAILAIVFWDSP